MRTHRRRTPKLGVIFAAALGSILGLIPTADAGPDDPMRYDGQRIVRVAPADAGQLDAVLDLVAGLWSERVGVGPIEVRVTPAQFDALTAMGLTPEILIDDVQVLIDAERTAMDLADRDPDPSFYLNYHTYDEIIAQVNQIAANHPNLATVSVIGQTLQGRDIVGIEITGPGDASNRPVIMFNGTQHAREWISPATVTYIADRLTTDYATDPRVTALLDRAVFKIVPIVNADGYSYTWTNQRLWRKNRRNNGNGTFGVDLNRNWDVNWGGDGSSGNTSSEIYRGTAPFSEPETRVIRDWMLGDARAVAHIDFHSYSQLILYPWGYADLWPPEPDRSFFVDFSQELADVILSVHGTSYTPQRGIDLYAASGTLGDWSYAGAGLKGWTIELRPATSGQGGFVLPPDQIIPTAEENFQAILTMGEQFSTPLRLILPQGAPINADADNATSFAVEVQELASTLMPGTARLVYSFDAIASFTSVPLTALGGNSFEATLPAAACGRSVEFAIEADAADGSTIRLPDNGVFVLEVVETTVVFFDPAETDLGWIVGAPGDTATTGIWERADPQGTAAQPEDDYSAVGTFCWITDGAAGSGVGSFDVDGGATTLTSPAMDATVPTGWWSPAEAFVRYARWYSNNKGNAPNQDSMPVRISGDDGASWTMLEDVSTNANAWVVRTSRVSDFVTPSPTVRLRFVARDEDAGSIVEAGVDDLAMLLRGCRYSPADLTGSNDPNDPGFGIPDGLIDAADFFFFLDLFVQGALRADLDHNGVLDAVDFFAYLALFANG